MTLPEMIKMTIKPSPFSIRAVSSAIVLALGLTAAPAGAADLTLDLPEQALSRSLNTIAQQGQIQLLYDAGQLGTLRAPALHGSYSAQTAIRTLLAGSGLTLVQQGSSYVIRPLTTEAETILIRKPGSGRAGLPSGHGCHVCPAIHYCGGDPPAQYR